MKKNFKGGFTLIELLVVIAIIGILASVVLASLNSARNKGADANIKAQLANARAQAELFYDAGNTYASVCTTAATSNGILDLLQASMKQYNGTTTIGTGASTASTASTAGTASCQATATAWAAIVPLKSKVGVSFCVDSTGVAQEQTTQLAASDTTCN